MSKESIQDDLLKKIFIILGILVISVVIFAICAIVGVFTSMHDGCLMNKADSKYINLSKIISMPAENDGWINTDITVYPNIDVNLAVTGKISLGYAIYNNKFNIHGAPAAVPNGVVDGNRPTALRNNITLDAEKNGSNWIDIMQLYEGAEFPKISWLAGKFSNLVGDVNTECKLSSKKEWECKFMHNPSYWQKIAWGTQAAFDRNKKQEGYTCGMPPFTYGYYVHGTEFYWSKKYQNYANLGNFSYSLNPTNLRNFLKHKGHPGVGECTYIQDPKAWYTDGVGLRYKFDGSNENYLNSKGSANSLAMGMPGGTLQMAFIDAGSQKIRSAFNHWNMPGYTGSYTMAISYNPFVSNSGKGCPQSGSADNGKVEYRVVTSSGDVIYSGFIQDISSDGKSKIRLTEKGELQLKIHYSPDIAKISPYLGPKYANGGYSINIDYRKPIWMGISDKFYEMQSLIKNICRDMFGSITHNTDFFLIVKSLLTLYVALFGIFYLLGLIKVTQMDLIMRIIKVAVVAGLTNESMYQFFIGDAKAWGGLYSAVESLMPMVIEKLSLAIYGDGSLINGPISFTSKILSKIFNPIFPYQMLSLLGVSIWGVFYYIIVFLAIIIAMIGVIKTLAVYLVAYFFLYLLLGPIAPFFLIFILFKDTRYLFQNWINSVALYILEPIVLIVGQCILCGLFFIYLDSILGFSVCFKCILPIKLPFAGVVFNGSDVSNLSLFCIPWFAPWGYDPYTGEGVYISFSNCIGLFIIAYSIYTYPSVASQIASSICNTGSMPSAIGAGVSIAKDNIATQLATQLGSTALFGEYKGIKPTDSYKAMSNILPEKEVDDKRTRLRGGLEMLGENVFGRMKSGANKFKEGLQRKDKNTEKEANSKKDQKPAQDFITKNPEKQQSDLQKEKKDDKDKTGSIDNGEKEVINKNSEEDKK